MVIRSDKNQWTNPGMTHSRRLLPDREPFNHTLRNGDPSKQEKGEIEYRQNKGHVSKEDEPAVPLEHSDSQEENCSTTFFL
jgi:hypothetical protein